MRVTPRFGRFLIILVIVAVIVVTVFFIIPSLQNKQNKEEHFLESMKTPDPADDLDVSAVDLSGKKMIVDAGHGGDDVGCIGAYSGRYEKEVNLEIAKKLQSLLSEAGVTVIMTRETDEAIAPTKEEDMAKREQIILDSNADMFISIHQNEFQSETATGPQVFYAYQGTVGKKLAVSVQEMLNHELQVTEPRMALDVPYQLLKPGSQPSCTVECGFFSNPEEEKKLQTDEYQQQIAQAIADGIKLYVKRYG